MTIALALAACGPYPRDIEGTTDHVAGEGVLRVAFAELDAAQSARAEGYTQRVADLVGARVSRAPGGSTEALLARLEEGQLDLVIAEVASDSPWVADVAVIEPLATRREGARVIGVSPIARGGENRWIGLLEREARDMKSGR